MNFDEFLDAYASGQVALSNQQRCIEILMMIENDCSGLNFIKARNTEGGCLMIVETESGKQFTIEAKPVVL